MPPASPRPVPPQQQQQQRRRRDHRRSRYETILRFRISARSNMMVTWRENRKKHVCCLFNSNPVPADGDANRLDEIGTNYLHRACWRNNLAELRHGIETLRGDPSVKDGHGNDCLRICELLGADALIEYLGTLTCAPFRRVPGRGEDTCPVCLDTLPLHRMRYFPKKCRHYCCKECLIEWLRVSTTCMMCRA